jgi:hypothetical protein
MYQCLFKLLGAEYAAYGKGARPHGYVQTIIALDDYNTGKGNITVEEGFNMAMIPIKDGIQFMVYETNKCVLK